MMPGRLQHAYNGRSCWPAAIMYADPENRLQHIWYLPGQYCSAGSRTPMTHHVWIVCSCFNDEEEILPCSNSTTGVYPLVAAVSPWIHSTLWQGCQYINHTTSPYQSLSSILDKSPHPRCHPHSSSLPEGYHGVFGNYVTFYSCCCSLPVPWHLRGQQRVTMDILVSTMPILIIITKLLPKSPLPPVGAQCSSYLGVAAWLLP